MALTAPVTNIPNLDAFLAKVATLVNTLDSKALPADGWALTDLEASVSEIIGDKRDLIDIVTKWDSAANSFAQWENLTAQQKAAIDDLKAQVESLAGSADEFEDILLWWDANYRTIFDVKEHTEVIHGDMESIHASEANVTQMKQDVTTLRDQVAADLQATNADRAAVLELKTAAGVSEANAKDSETKAKTSEQASASSAAEAKADAAATAADRVTTIQNREWTASARGQAQAAQIKAEAAATTATDQADRAKSEADRSKTEADRAEEAALVADGTATRAVTERVNTLLAEAPEAYDTLSEIAAKLAEQDGVDAALVQQISGKANKVHTHTTDQVTGLDSALDDKASKTELSEGLSEKSDIGHEHAVADVTGLQPALDGKVASNGEANKIYGTNASGKDTTYPLGGSVPQPGSVALRGAGGTLAVGTPTDGTHSTTKTYVDTAVSKVKSTAEAALPASKIQVVTTMPTKPDANTIYLVTGA